MNNGLTRQYDLPKSVSTSTSSLIKQHKPNSTPSLNNNKHNIPDVHDLSNIKADLESILALTENRIKDLKKDLIHLDKNNEDSTSITTSGKNVNTLMEKMRIKQESDTSNMLHDASTSSNIPTTATKNEQSRQAALETIRRRRRREDTESSEEINTRSESPHHLIKLKKLDMTPTSTSSSSSPPPLPPPPPPLPTSPSMTSIARAHHQNKEVDFVRVKPKDQVPITTFWSTLEPYFRNLTEEDRNFLLQKSDQGKPYLIPPLGRHYLEKWAEEEEELSLKITTKPMQHEERPAEEGSSLTERLISSLVIENIMDYEQLNEDEDEEIGDENRITPIDPMIEKKYNAKTVVEMSIDPTEEIVSFEERLKRELRYAGLFGDEDVDWNAKEDDEICAELRALGHEYKEQVKINEYRKKRLLEVVDCQLQYEQYRQVLDTLDSQVEQGYLKRFRPQKSKKRKSTGPKATLSENTLYVMEKRKTWINALSHIFKDKNMTMPSSSIYDLLPEDDNNTSI